MVRFQSVLVLYEADELNQIEAAEMFGVSERTFRRWCRRFKGEDETGLLDRGLGHPSAKRAPADDEQMIERMYKTGASPRNISTSISCATTYSGGATPGRS
jgi:transposase